MAWSENWTQKHYRRSPDYYYVNGPNWIDRLVTSNEKITKLKYSRTVDDNNSPLCCWWWLPYSHHYSGAPGGHRTTYKLRVVTLVASPAWRIPQAPSAIVHLKYACRLPAINRASGPTRAWQILTGTKFGYATLKCKGKISHRTAEYSHFSRWLSLFESTSPPSCPK